MIRSQNILPLRAAGRAVLLCASLAGCGSAEVAKARSELLRVQADQVVDPSGNPVSLRGVQFDSWIFSGIVDQDPPTTYAGELDYERVAAMGMNTVALFFRYDQFEDDAAPGVYKQDGFKWLDQNIAWAKASAVRLVLTLGLAPGGPITVCDGNTLWDIPDYQRRTVALWQAIAKVYASEPVIAGYNVLSNPLPSGTAEQWQAFSGQLVAAIREVDARHILVVEPAVGAACSYKAIAGTDLFPVNDPNVLYAFYADVPYEYLYQDLASQGLGDGGSYPDDTPHELDFDAVCAAADGSTVSCLQYQDIGNSTPPDSELDLTAEQTNWTKQQFVYRITSQDAQFGIPEFESDNNSGKVYFDDFVVNEYDEALNFVRTVMAVDPEDLGNWYLWQGDSDGIACSTCGAMEEHAAIELSRAHSGHASVSIRNFTTLANLSNNSLAFPTKFNYTYEMIGWLKGEHSDPKATSRFQLAFWKDNGGAPLARNKDSQALYLRSFVAWGKAQHVPLFVDEFRAGRPTFTGDKGGLLWVEDMVDLLKANDLHFAYGEYHGDDFGIYLGNHGLPDPALANQPLIDLFTRELVP